MENNSSPSVTPAPHASFPLLLPALAVSSLLAVGAFVYFQFFSPALQQEEEVVADEVSDDSADPVYAADYNEGYSAGYADGRSVNGKYFDSYQEPATLERKQGYFEGYLAGYLRGCEEGGFDCSDVVQAGEDYSSGYDAGYRDGVGELSEVFDSYVRPETEQGRRAYLPGYFDGFFDGCRDGEFDCSAVEMQRAVYDEGYGVGYADGVAETSDFLDTYVEPTNPDVIEMYNEGYFDGFLDGCNDGDFDCSHVVDYRAQLQLAPLEDVQEDVVPPAPQLN